MRIVVLLIIKVVNFEALLVLEISFKRDLSVSPPPYSEHDEGTNAYRQVGETDLAALDLLANCQISPIECSSSEAEYAEISEMGIWHSTPISKRHKSKISLTWVLKENTETAQQLKKNPERLDLETYQIKNLDDRRKRRRDRIVGRKEQYLRVKSASDVRQDSSDDAPSDDRRRSRHRHRKKHRHADKFGYDIRDLDWFLSESSIDRPGNIPVVVAYPTHLYQTHGKEQRQLPLPLGTVVNAVFKNQQWLYAQTPHGDEGYLLYCACLPLGIIPERPSPQKKTPCWESSTDIYPRPCGNLTDNEKEQLRGRTRSECNYRPKSYKNHRAKAEENFDVLYLKTKSLTNTDKVYEDCESVSRRSRIKREVRRQMLLVVNSDFEGSPLNRTLSVHKDEVVVLLSGKEIDLSEDWYYVRKRDGEQGFIPAIVTGNGYI